MGFQISALNVGQFTHLFDLDDEALAKNGVERMVVDSNPGYPCRVSLQDAEIGETVSRPRDVDEELRYLLKVLRA